ncbi:MAG: helix-turn-helix transcriptional regulator [Haloferacaceae archaeon]
MAPDTAASDTAAFLAGSDDRTTLLTYLAGRAAAPATVADDLSLARRSVQRHLAGFVERGWATREEGTYRLTTAGELIADEHASYRETLARIEEFDAFYGHLPDREHAPEPRWLRDADVTVATDADPQAPIHRYLTRVRSLGGDRIRMIAPVLSRLFHDVHADLAVEGTRTELVMADDRIERARDLNPVEFAVVVGVDVLDLYRHPGPIEFGVTLGEECALLCAYDDGRLEACVEARNPELLAWAGRLFDRYRSRAEPIDPPVPLPSRPGTR